MSDIFDHESDVWESLENDSEPTYYPKPVKCKYCGMKGLSWKEVERNKWRLFKYNTKIVQLELHACKL